jgi:hypothetical protein
MRAFTPFLALLTLQEGRFPHRAEALDGRYWARTSDPQLVELVLSQLS